MPRNPTPGASGARVRRNFGVSILFLALAATVGGVMPTRAAELDRAAAIRKLTESVASSYDSARGGFVEKDAPNEASIELAWRLARTDPAWRFRARRSVMWTWGLHDSIGGGFLHGAGDARHDVTSFEKRTDDNARRLENLIDAWLDSRSDAGREAGGPVEWDRRGIRQTIDFFDRTLLDPRGGFVAGQVGDRTLVPADNGLAIRAIMRWASLTGEPRWRDFAWKSLDRVKASSWNPEFGFLRMGPLGQVMETPRLDDQVEMGRAYVISAHLSGRAADLESAREIGTLLLKYFEDRRQGGMRWQVSLRKDGTVKNASRDPEPNARAARFLVELASVTGEQRFRDAAERLMQAFVPDRGKPAADDAEWVLAMRGFERAELPERGEWKEKPKETEAARPQVTRIGKRRR